MFLTIQVSPRKTHVGLHLALHSISRTYCMHVVTLSAIKTQHGDNVVFGMPSYCSIELHKIKVCL